MVSLLIGIFDGRGNIADIPLDRGAGEPPLYLRFWQTVASTPTDGPTSAAKGKRAVRLQTLEYNYHLCDRAGEDPILRWEYVKVPKDNAQFCRNHLQGRLALSSGDAHVDFKKMHVPTGYITLEEIFASSSTISGIVRPAATLGPSSSRSRRSNSTRT